MKRGRGEARQPFCVRKMEAAANVGVPYLPQQQHQQICGSSSTMVGRTLPTCKRPWLCIGMCTACTPILPVTDAY
ncbi:hypothetical protein GOP47_0022009 [Adiantum capillus-veneris]|uniref:Uncharacterized protein n=1 Tax=Adiantum capillus-veneris TaxID=13818 RepID=A0A9D4U9E7_ADICA|nr:hypothetical protein GOP47_0022009 [Adiantum capillus-veneris]